MKYVETNIVRCIARGVPIYEFAAKKLSMNSFFLLVNFFFQMCTKTIIKKYLKKVNKKQKIPTFFGTITKYLGLGVVAAPISLNRSLYIADTNLGLSMSLTGLPRIKH